MMNKFINEIHEFVTQYKIYYVTETINLPEHWKTSISIKEGYLGIRQVFHYFHYCSSEILRASVLVN
jgi:hypothetical protein